MPPTYYDLAASGATTSNGVVFSNGSGDFETQVKSFMEYFSGTTLVPWEAASTLFSESFFSFPSRERREGGLARRDRSLLTLSFFFQLCGSGTMVSFAPFLLSFVDAVVQRLIGFSRTSKICTRCSRPEPTWLACSRCS